MFDAEGKPTGGAQLCPAVAAGDVSWKHVALHSGLVGISGGFNDKPYAAHYIDVPVGDDIERFIHLSRKAEWFLKGAGGRNAQNGTLKAVNVLDIIRDRLEKIYASEAEEDAMEKPEEVDPMEQLSSQLETPKKAAKRKVATKTWRRSLIKEIDVPRSPEGVTTSTAVTQIVVYSPDSGQRFWKCRPI